LKEQREGGRDGNRTPNISYAYRNVEITVVMKRNVFTRSFLLHAITEREREKGLRK